MARFNFAASLIEGLTSGSQLIDAADGQVFGADGFGILIARTGAGLRSLGLAPGDRLVIAAPLGGQPALVYLGAIHAGIVPVPVEPNAFRDKGREIVERCRAVAAWAPSAVATAGAGALPCRLISGDVSVADAMPPHSSSPDDLAVLMATSGSVSAGMRFVRVTHENLDANSGAIVRSQRLNASDRALLILPIYYCFGASVLHTHLLAGGSVVFDSRFMFPDKVLKSIQDYTCTTLAGVPTVYRALLARSNVRKLGVRPLRRFLQAGGPLDSGAIREFRAIAPEVEFFVMYGQTEATSRITTLDPRDLEAKIGSVGVPLDNVEVRICDQDGNPCAPGSRGEILVRGRSVCAGYWEDVEADARTFRNGWLHTGDEGYRDSDGFLWITGRLSDFIKVRGVRLSLAEVEHRVMEVEGVRECGAYAVSHAEAGEAFGLYVVPRADATDGMAKRVRAHMPATWVCTALHMVDALPSTATGKVSRALMAEMAARGDG